MSPAISLGDVVARRVLECRLPDSSSTEVVVQIGKPVADDGDYLCPYRIAGAGVDRTRAMAGVDSAQALLSSLHAVSAELEWIARETRGRITWLGMTDLGFPVPTSGASSGVA